MTLTLNIEKKVVERAEKYAQKNSLSLPQLIEDYLISIIQIDKKREKTAINPLVESLTGVIPSIDVDNYKEDYQNYLLEKYL